MDIKLTKKQRLVLEFIDYFTKNHDYSPSYREIMSGLGLSSVSAVAEHIENLVTLGVLKKSPGAARSLEIVSAIHPAVPALFKERLASATPEQADILLRAANILGFNLE